ncbi:hypothetical protein, partial [Mycobacterium sp. THU-M104]|uniref:hypothetical protein n=1 Tax=Mycobacterium sp. THU-M104 TaxID=3410515 RepID=UPI003B9FEDEC
MPDIRLSNPASPVVLFPDPGPRMFKPNELTSALSDDQLDPAASAFKALGAVESAAAVAWVLAAACWVSPVSVVTFGGVVSGLRVV